jgi:tetratricopeptide (TPR) repeat protein
MNMKDTLIPKLFLALCVAFGTALADARIEDGSLLVQGDAYDARLDTAQALESYLQAEKLGRTDADLLYRIARQYALSMNDTDSREQQKERGERALDYAQRAVAADPRHAKAQLSVAICYGRLLPFGDARTKVEYSRLIKEHAEIALRLDPSDSYAYHVLGAWNYELAKLNPIMRSAARIIYGALPEASNEEAVRLLREAVSRAPERVSHHVELGRAYAALGQTSDARSELQTALGLPNREKDDPESKRRAVDALRDLDD